MNVSRTSGTESRKRCLNSSIEYEHQIVGMNRALDSGSETVSFMAEAQRHAMASRLVKDIARPAGDVSRFAAPAVKEALSGQLHDHASDG